VRLILDESVDVRLMALLIAAGHDVVALALFGRFVMKDTDVLAAATADTRVVISTDRDFMKSVFWRRPHHAGFIMLGLSNLDTAYQAAEVDRVVSTHEKLEGSVVAILDDGVRISQGRPPIPAVRRAPTTPSETTRKKHVRRRR
jgi:predicted nuclease of predicted toxin-antitoxin system